MSEPDLPVNQVIRGDCIEVLQSFPEASIDLVFADPPYNLQLQGELRRPDNSLVDAVTDAWDRFESFAAYDEFTRAWLSACKRVLKVEGTLWVIGTYHNIHRVGAILQDLGFWILNQVVWIKQNPMPNFRGVRFTNAHEILIWAQKQRGARYTFNHQAMKALNDDLQMRSDWVIPLCTGRERIKVNGEKAHATQKPEALLYRVLLSSTNPGDLVLDPFFGTGTTGAVAKKLHRRWIGVERDPQYAEIARRRIEAVEPGEYAAEVFHFPQKRRLARIPFGSLLERGMLQPGQTLYLPAAAPAREAEPLEAVILANGHLLCNGQTGSIHQVARAILGTACNGWDQWYYRDPESGELKVIDTLRKSLREADGL
jgi:DNA modification methylase